MGVHSTWNESAQTMGGRQPTGCPEPTTRPQPMGCPQTVRCAHGLGVSRGQLKLMSIESVECGGRPWPARRLQTMGRPQLGRGARPWMGGGTGGRAVDGRCRRRRRRGDLRGRRGGQAIDGAQTRGSHSMSGRRSTRAQRGRALRGVPRAREGGASRGARPRARALEPCSGCARAPLGRHGCGIPNRHTLDHLGAPRCAATEGMLVQAPVAASLDIMIIRWRGRDPPAT